MGMKNAKRCISFLMAVILILGLMPSEGIILRAAETDANIENSSENGVLYRNYNIESKEWSEEFCKDYTLVQTSTSTLNAGWYVAEGNVSFSSLTIDGEVHLILTDGCKLTVSSGVHVPESSSLTIYAQSEGETMGILEATGGNGGIHGEAGIGGYYCDGDDNKFNNGPITINGGKITATGSKFGAGIGGGGKNDSPNFYSKGSNITINGGDITASGGQHGAGIGGGVNGNGINITINGGKVTATGGSGGAGIGGGSWILCNTENEESSGNGENIIINGGEVKAISSDSAAAIGGGVEGHGENITINGGTVTAEGGYMAAGIGGGKGGETKNNYGKNIYIEGGEIEAVGGYYGTGIGGGYACDGTYIYIKGGQVAAAGGEGAAGIGGSYAGNGSNIFISGGKVTASGGAGGAGIGGGEYYQYVRTDGSNGTDISIENCEVIAVGGQYAAGIGGGYGSFAGSANGTDISISNSKVIATGGGDWAAGIGGGYTGNGTGISINNSIVWATGGGNAKHIGNGGNGISSQSTKESSIIFEGGIGRVYQSAVIGEDKEIEIKEGESLTVPKNASLLLSGTMVNNGEITIYSENSLSGEGSLSGSGKFWIENAAFTGDDIIVPEGMVYNGTDQTAYAQTESTLNPTDNTKRTVCNTEFIVKNFDKSGWIKSIVPAEVKDAGTYSVVYTKDSNSLSKEFKVAQAAMSYNDSENNTTLKSCEGTEEKTEFTYGSTITIKATPRLTGAAAQTVSDELRANTYTEPSAGEIAVFMEKDGEIIQLAEAKTAVMGEEISFDINTFRQNLTPDEYTLSVRYTGTENIADYSENITVTVAYHEAKDAVLSKENQGDNGWYVGEVTVKAPEGYQIASQNTENAGWQDNSIKAEYLSLDENGDYIYYLKQTSTGYLTDTMTLTAAKIDAVKPAFGNFAYTEGRPGEEIFTKLWNWLIGKDYITVTVPITEAESGLTQENIQIRLVNPDETTDSTVTPEEINLTGTLENGYTLSFVIPAAFDGHFIVTAKDTAGNESDSHKQRTVIDTTEPDVDIKLNDTSYDETKNTFENSVAIDISVNDSLNGEISAGLREVTYSLDGNASVLLAPEGGFDSTADTFTPVLNAGTNVGINEKGAHTLSVCAEDHAGNKTEKEISFRIYCPTSLSLSEKEDASGVYRIIYDEEAIEAGTDFIVTKEGSEEEIIYSYKRSDAGDDSYKAGLPAESGKYTIKAEIPQDDKNFYFGAEATLELVIEKAPAEGKSYTLQIVKQKEHTVPFDLSEMLPKEVKGAVIYSIADIDNKDGLLSQDTLPSAGELNQSTLSLNTEAVQEAGKRAVLTISFSNANYEISNALLIIETTEKIPLEISGIEISGAEQQKLIYSGNAASYSGEPKAETKDGQVVSLENSDYQFLWYQMENDAYTEIPDNTAPVDAGSYKLIIKGENSDYLGTQEIPFEIVKMDISDAAVTLGEELIFNGAAQTQTLAEVKAGGLSLTEKDYTITENIGCEAGTYTMTITGTGNFTGTVEKEFAIAPLPVNLVWNTQTFTYDGEAHSVSADVSNAVGGYDVSVSAYDNQSAVDAGSYTAEAKALDNSNYTLEGGANLSAEYTIEKLDISERTDLEVLLGDALVYNGEAQTQSVTSVKIKDMDVTCQISGNSGTNAGTYIMILTGTGNFTGSKNIYFVIQKAPTEAKSDIRQVVKQKKHTISYDLSALLPKEVTGTTIYSIKEINNNDNLLSADTMPSVGILDTNKLSFDTEAAKTAGKRAVFTISFSNTNYEISDAFLTIETTDKIPVKISGTGISGMEESKLPYSGIAAVYSGTPKAETEEGEIAGLTDSDYQYDWYQLTENEYVKMPDNIPPVNVGSYKLVIKGENNDYLGIQEIPFEIVKMDISDAGVTLGEKLIFNGAAQTQILAEVKAGGLSLTEKDYTVTGNTGCEAGTYTMTITGTGNFTGTIEKEFAIAPLPVKLVWNTQTFTYDGEAHSVSADVSNAVSGYEISVSAYDNESAVDAGSYTAEAKALDNPNYTLEGGANLSAEYIIEKLDISERTDLEVLLGDALVYNGEAQTQSVTSVKIKDMDVTCQILGNSGTNAGTYILTLTGTGNFTGSKSISFIIQKAPVEGNSHTMRVAKQQKHTISYDLSALLPKEVTGTTIYSIADINNEDGLLSENTLPSAGVLTASSLSFDTEAVEAAGKRAQFIISFENANYEISNAVLLIETADKIPVKISGVGITGMEESKLPYSGIAASYSGTPKAETEEGQIAGLTDSDYQYDWYQLTENEYVKMPDNTPPVNVGSYKLVIKGENNDYLGIQEIPFEIVKMDISDADVTLGEKLIFNGAVQTQTLAEVKAGGLSLTEKDYTVTGNTGCEVKSGDYTLTITGTGNFTGSVKKEFTIAPLPVNLVWNTQTFTYDGKTHIISADVSNAVSGYDVSVSAYNNESAVDAGSYTAEAKALDNPNYTLEGGTNLSAEYTIEKLDISERTDLEVLLGDALVYNGEAQTQSVTSVKIKDMDVTCQISDNTQTNAGTYILTLTGTGNFTGSKSISFTIDQAENAPNMPESSIELPVRNGRKVSDIPLSSYKNWIWSADDADTLLPTAENETLLATAWYEGTDKANYKNISQQILITVVKCGHSSTSLITEKEPSCTSPGIGHRYCEICDMIIEENIEIDALGHIYNTPEFIWSGDYSSAEALFTCIRSGCSKEENGHTQSVPAEVTSEKNGNLTIYTASISFNGNIYTDKKQTMSSSEETRFQIFEGITDIPEPLKNAGYDTEEKIIKACVKTVLEHSGYQEDNTVTYDIILQVSFDGGKTWETATEKNFPKEGITVVLPYPEGTNRADYDFIATHMFSHTMNGHKAGEIETPAVTKTEKELRFTVQGLSPIMLAWKSINSEKPSEKPSETPSEKPSETPSETPSEKPSETPSETPSEKPSETSNNKPIETSGEETTPDSPSTGDRKKETTFLILLLLSSAELTALYYSKRKKLT